MPFQISCPECNLRLTADDSTVGMMVACSSCGAKFAVKKPNSAVVGVTSPTTKATKKGTAKFKGILGQPAPTATTAGAAPSPPTANVSPPQSSEPATANPPQNAWPPGAQGKQAAVASPPPTARQTAPPAAPAKPVSAAQAKPSSTTSPSPAATPTRSVQRAKFVTVDPAETTIQLGVDGNLPELVLQKHRKPEEEDDADTAGKTPWMMIVALLVSFAASIMLLLVPMNDGPAESRDQKGARDVLADYYIRNTFNPNAPPEEYQNTLRRALRAHDQGDLAEEQRLYRQTLDMLASENLNELRGLTGVPAGDDHPSDIMLRRLLAELLRE